MSSQLASLGITINEGYCPEHLQPAPDCVLVGNAVSRGNPAVESMLTRGMAYESGPRWLAEHLLKGQRVLAVAGTHGKTTTSSMLAWILECAGLNPGFLIGGIPKDFGVSARAGGGRLFVVEADEYDTAFFDKGSKFLHYRPQILILNNLEYDHADIFPDLASIETQFQYLLRTVPGNGLIVANATDLNLQRVFQRGCWTPQESFALANADWSAKHVSKDGASFNVSYRGKIAGMVEWEMLGLHNVQNALAAIAAARAVGVEPRLAAEALIRFQGVKRRLEIRARINGAIIYDDFAHHPTAISATLAGLRQRVGSERILAVLEPRSASMKMGVHRETLAAALQTADRVFVYQAPNVNWDVTAAMQTLAERVSISTALQELVGNVAAETKPGDHVVIMSNGGFGGFHEKLIEQLEQRAG